MWKNPQLQTNWKWSLIGFSVSYLIAIHAQPLNLCFELFETAYVNIWADYGFEFEVKLTMLVGFDSLF